MFHILLSSMEGDLSKISEENDLLSGKLKNSFR